MRSKSFFLAFLIFYSFTLQVKSQSPPAGENLDVSFLRTFGTMGKEQKVLKKDEEAELFSFEGIGTITHMWFGGSFKNVEYTSIRIYIDGEEEPSIDMEL